MLDSFKLNGKRALISGGSRGIGLGIASALAEAGATVALISRDAQSLATARKQLVSEGASDVEVYPFDMTRIDEIDDLYSRVLADGEIDILVNNAGGTRRGTATEISDSDWQFVMDLNVTAVFKLSQSFGRQRIEAGKPGKIVNIASLMSETVRKDNAPYAASKGAIRQLTKALAIDWAPHRINVNAIGPGYIRTDLTRPLWEDAEFTAWVQQRTPLATWGSPQDIGGAAVYLAAPASNFVTGQTLYVDGGWLSTF